MSAPGGRVPEAPETPESLGSQGVPGAAGGAAFADLRTRSLSAGVMLGLGGIGVFWGGWVFAALVLVAVAGMSWELMRLGLPDRPGLGAVVALATAGATLAAALRPWAPDLWLMLALGPALMLLAHARDRLVAALWTLGVELAGLGLILAREQGLVAVVWLIGLVIASDALGYFAGRLIGGPKFWPRISPKKTWSGTLAGWLGAVLWTAALLPVMPFEPAWALVAAAPFLAMAGQAGDIYESWVKRRAGVKDASNLIPGHGGLMDRFDAVTGASAAFLLAHWLCQGLWT